MSSNPKAETTSSVILLVLLDFGTVALEDKIAADSIDGEPRHRTESE